MKKNRYKLASLLIITALLSGYLSLLAPNEMETYSAVEPDEFSIAETYDWTVFEKDMNVTTFVAPDGSYEELQHILNEAEDSLYVEIYGINNPEILDWLNIMHDSNPSMDIKVLIGWNSLGYTSVNRFVANNLTQEGIDVKWTGAGNFTFAHQKYFVIDNKTTVVHAGNWAKTSFAPYNYRTNREWSIAMTDVDVAGYYLSVFDGDWINGTVYDPIEHGTGTALTDYGSTSTYPRPFSDRGHFSGDMKVIPIFSPDTSLQGILYCINSAKYTLDIQIPYFTSVGDGGAVDQVIDAILDAKARGVTVRVITDEEKDYLEIAHMLTEVDIPVVWHDTRWFSANHNKGIIVDGHIVLVSSINYSDGSITANREAGVIIDNYEIAQWFQQIYDFDFSMADHHETDEVGIYWNPNIPKSTDTINVTVFTHNLYNDVTDVSLGVKIDDGSWNNYSITANVFDSVETDPENYFYEISPQADGTNITVQATVQADGFTNMSLPMVIHIVDNVIGSISVNSPVDIEYQIGDTDNFINWTPVADNPDYYSVTVNGSNHVSGPWDGSPIDINVDGLELGAHLYTLFVNETGGENITDAVYVFVRDLTPIAIDGPLSLDYEEGTSGHRINWTVSADNPDSYLIELDDVEVDSGPWNGSSLSIGIDGLSVGSYTYVLTVNETDGKFASHQVNVTVDAIPTTTSTTSTSTTNTTTTVSSTIQTTTTTSSTVSTTTTPTSTSSTTSTLTTTTSTTGGGIDIVIIAIVAVAGIVLVFCGILGKKNR